MRYRDVFIIIRIPITGQIKGWYPHWISIKVNPSGASYRPDLLRYQSIAVLQYGGTIDALFVRQIQGLQNLCPIYYRGKNHGADVNPIVSNISINYRFGSISPFNTPGLIELRLLTNDELVKSPT